jgi:BirA family biotin operon repressor/biotin-[acetyl-CoA-carboxylase] ligase
MEYPERSGRNLKESILRALVRGDLVSGESLSRNLAVSRPAIWKIIGHLKRDGYQIESRPGKGYFLKTLPDILFPDLLRYRLKSQVLGKNITHFLRTDSTNIQAKILAADGAVDGTVVVAEYQEKGKGRLQRLWQSPAGKNLLFSLILRPDWPPQQAFFGTVLASVSLCLAIKEIAGIDVRIKWPNDLYVEGEKIAGILTEFTTDPDRIEYMIVGVGVNCHWSPSEPPPGGMPATSILKKAGRKISRLDLLTRFLEYGDTAYQKTKQEGIGFLREEWDRYSLVTQRTVTLINNQATWTGEALGIDEQGGLILRLKDGRRETFLAGDVHLRF